MGTLKKEDEIPSDIYGTRPRRTMFDDNMNKEGFTNLGFVKELDEVGDDEIDSVLGSEIEGSNIGSAYSRNSAQFEDVVDMRPPSFDSGNMSNSRYSSKKSAPPPPPI